MRLIFYEPDDTDIKRWKQNFLTHMNLVDLFFDDKYTHENLSNHSRFCLLVSSYMFLIRMYSTTFWDPKVLYIAN